MLETNRTISILSDLISRRSDVDAPAQRDESSVVSYVRGLLEGVEGMNVNVDVIDGGRCNIAATTSPAPKIVFVGHMDTVEVTNEKQCIPYVDGDKLYGRGSLDMKAGVAMMLDLALENTYKDVAFLFTVGEEYDFIGALKAREKQSTWKPDVLINLEPTGERLLTQCRGVCEMTVRLKGKSAHAGVKDKGVNAITQIYPFAGELERLIQAEDEGGLQSSLNIAWNEGGVENSLGEIVSRPNMVPDTVDIVFEVRLGSRSMTQERLATLVTQAAIASTLTVASCVPGLWFGPMVTKKDAEEVLEFKEEMKSAGNEVKELNPNRGGFYELQLFQSIWNCPVIVYGPGPSEQAHKDDEYVNISSVVRVEQVVRSYLLRKEMYSTIGASVLMN